MTANLETSQFAWGIILLRLIYTQKKKEPPRTLERTEKRPFPRKPKSLTNPHPTKHH